jgi:hypothetical protein
VIGFTANASSAADDTKYNNSIFATAEDADWCTFVQCSVINAGSTRDGDSNLGHYSADFYCTGRMTGVIRCFGDISRTTASHADCVWSVGQSHMGFTGQNYPPCPFIYRSWFKGNALNTAGNEGGPTPIQFGENNGYGTAIYGSGVLETYSPVLPYGAYWTGG